MKAIRTHDYRIDGYGNVNFIKKSISAAGIRPQGFLEARRSRKRNPNWALPPGARAAIIATGRKRSYRVMPLIYSEIRDHKVRKRCFWHALAELRRL